MALNMKAKDCLWNDAGPDRSALAGTAAGTVSRQRRDGTVDSGWSQAGVHGRRSAVFDAGWHDDARVRGARFAIESGRYRLNAGVVAEKLLRLERELASSFHRMNVTMRRLAPVRSIQ